MTFGHIGLADTGKHVMGITRPVVFNDDGDVLLIVIHRYGDLFPRIIHAVFNEVAETVDDTGIADTDRLVGAIALFNEFEADAEFPVRGHHLLDQRRERQAAHMFFIVGGKRCEPAQNVTASFALAAQHAISSPNFRHAQVPAPSPSRRR